MRRSVTATMGAVVLAGAAATVAVPAHATARVARPSAEHVPAAVDHVRIAYRDSANPSQNKTVNLHGRRADHIIDLFDALKREPPDTAHCLIASTAETRVIFKGTHHRWVATEAICTDLEVARDGRSLPTLVVTKAWDAALTHYLGHSPTGTPEEPQPQ
ncbi:MAG TPA: hypothetical protein VHD81_13105 [Mycobacteriales bacterium]|nr:hypothetical protein [Mycobacteriales bacterium]